MCVLGYWQPEEDLGQRQDTSKILLVWGILLTKVTPTPLSCPAKP